MNVHFSTKIQYILAVFFAALMSQSLSAQQNDMKYWVFFNQKNALAYKYNEHLSARTIHQRQLQGLPLEQYTDIPVEQSYVDEIEIFDLKIICKSKWLNAVSIRLSPSEVSLVKTLPFVSDVRPIEQNLLVLKAEDAKHQNKKKVKMGRAMEQLELEVFREEKLDGAGVLIGVIDAGFYGSHKSDYLQHLITDSSRVVGMKDWVKPSQKDLFREKETDDDDHGKTVLEMIGGYNDKGKQLGAATASQFLLARTDHGVNETRTEEDYWIAAMEWMDSIGVRIINTSLGYSVGFDEDKENYKPDQMDGSTSAISKATRIAFEEKGILLVVSAGNEGWDSDWKIVSTPGDSPFALSVGATNGAGLKMGYSSIGADFVEYLKPNVSCYSLTGTSFSAPNITGFAACLWQYRPEASNKEIFSAIEKSASLYPYGNNYVGYGIPKASKALQLLEGDSLESDFTSLKVSEDRYKLTLPQKKRALIYHKKDKHIVVNQFSELAKDDKPTTKIIIKRPDEDIKFTTIFIDGIGGIEIEWE